MAAQETEIGTTQTIRLCTPQNAISLLQVPELTIQQFQNNSSDWRLWSGTDILIGVADCTNCYSWCVSNFWNDQVHEYNMCKSSHNCNQLIAIHTHTQPFNSLLSGTTRVGRHQKKHSSTHTHLDHRTSFIIFLHLERSMASSLFSTMCLTVLSDNISPGPLWSSSWPWTLNFILHAFLHPIVIIFIKCLYCIQQFMPVAVWWHQEHSGFLDIVYYHFWWYVIFCFVCLCRICYLGERLLALDKIRNNDTGEIECNKFENGSIYALYCGRVKTDPETGDVVQVTAENDGYCRYFHEHNVTLRPGIPGLASGVFLS